MVKLTGRPNYKIAEIDRLLTIVEEHLPLGKDEWERVATDYNVGRSHGWVESDLNSLRRKFKTLYSMRKPTGTAEMSPHVEKAKWVKRAVDDKANVVEMDDATDRNQDEFSNQEEEGLFVEPNFSFEPSYDEQDCTDDAVSEPRVLASDSKCGSQDTSAGDRPGAAGADRGVAITNSADDAVTTKTSKLSAARGYQPGGRDKQEALRHVSLQSSSNRLGGGNLYVFRDSVGSKRASDDEGQDQADVSFAKAKRLRALKTTTALKNKLVDLENAGSNLISSTLEMLLIFREESERKSEARRIEEEARRRDEAAAKEARLQADKLEASGRCHQEKLEAEESVRRDKDEARARMQDMLVLIGATFKKE
ncbi:unnamed protein product [Phytophthora fragariaefolia]|uniref:Unnamed protein product n=1 Tax=Phytophthora fragariaefolia TaxID=1490495 RepID=A0A9W6U551_9STRA|nr:unnamed protein product [Phytophthora fragariaefolia]